ncbi:amidohydrolase family protein [Kribbella sp. NPDC020789]
MTRWVFDGISLPTGEQVHLEAGTGAAETLPGRFVLPGLVDSHCHLTIGVSAAGPVRLDEPTAEAMLDDLAEAGVRAVRDVGGDRSITLKLATSPADGHPLVLAAGRFFAPDGGYFPGIYEPVEADQLVTAVEAELNEGATWIKLVADFPPVDDNGPIPGRAMTPNYTIDAVEQLIATAHAHGARVAAHVQTALVSDLIRAGIDSVEHGEVITPEDLAALGARGGAWTPTISAYGPPNPDDTPERQERRRVRTAHMTEMLPLARQYGVHVLTGSDMIGTVAGEVAQLANHGLTPAQALEAATTSAATFLGLTTTEDLVTYDADPRDDPAVLATPTAVLLRGHRIR